MLDTEFKFKFGDVWYSYISYDEAFEALYEMYVEQCQEMNYPKDHEQCACYEIQEVSTDDDDLEYFVGIHNIWVKYDTYGSDKEQHFHQGDFI